MLELRPRTVSPARQVDFVELAFGDVTCRDLPPDSPDARICTYECTFCAECVDARLGGVCPNCGGNFERRPIRPPGKLLKHPASTLRIHQPEGCA